MSLREAFPEMTPEMEEHVLRVLAEAPPLKPHQVNNLRLLLGGPEPLPPFPKTTGRRPAQVINRYIPKALRAELLLRPCAYCGGRATQIDHKLPVSRGGGRDRANLAPACANCNFEKGDRTPEEWLGPDWREDVA